jgi:hypothetical protein
MLIDFEKLTEYFPYRGFLIKGRGNPINTDVKASTIPSSAAAKTESISSRNLRSKQLHG